ncbi:MAG: DUF4252 domain-containing protein [Pseudomonadota bacterium]
MKFPAFLAASAATVLLALPAVSTAASPRLDIPSFNHLRDKANDSVNLTIGGPLLRFVSRIAASDDDADPEQKAAVNILKEISSVTVRSFSFDEEGAYSMADIDAVRAQLNAPGWTRLVEQHKREPKEDTDVFMCLEDGKIKGIAVITSEPREFTIVNVIGNIDIDKLAKLEGEFGIPRISKD